MLKAAFALMVLLLLGIAAWLGQLINYAYLSLR